MSPFPQINNSFVSLQKRSRPPRDSHWTCLPRFSTTGHKAPHITAGCGNPVGGIGFQAHAKVSEILPLPLLGVHKNIKLHNHNISAEDLLAQTHTRSMFVASVSGSLYEPCSVNSVSPVLSGVLGPSGSYNPSSPSSLGYLCPPCVWLWVSASAPVGCWITPIWWQLG